MRDPKRVTSPDPTAGDFETPAAASEATVRDTVLLRTRLAMLACLPLACSKPPSPDTVQQEEPERAGRSAARDGRPGSTESMERRVQYYERKAREQGKSFDEVAPEKVKRAKAALATRGERGQRAGRERAASDRRPAASDRRPAPDKRASTDERREFYGARDDRKPAERRDDPRAASTERREYYAKQDRARQARADGGRTPERAVLQVDRDRDRDAVEAPVDSAFTPVPGDPPWIDGYNDEEATCPSGNWCGALPLAAAIMVGDARDADLKCPVKITGAVRGDNPPDLTSKPYEGLSAKPAMQGTLNQHGTSLWRERKSVADLCCYHWFEYCSGRPHLADTGPVVADTAPGRAWMCTPPQGEDERDEERRGRLTIAALPSAVRQRIADAWLDDARAEHASIAAFARATLELMAVGAPPDLVAGCQRAGLDEVDHAQRCFTMAARYGRAARQPGALPALSPRTGGKARVARDTFAEGCVGETIAALVAERAARNCTDGTVADALSRIAADEARHAALAWATVDWAVRSGDRQVAAGLMRAAAQLRPPPEPMAPASVDPHSELLAEHGRLDDAAMREATADAWRDIIGPMLDQILAGASAPRPRTAPSAQA